MGKYEKRDPSVSDLYSKDCDDCVRMKKRRESPPYHFNAGQARFCVKHQCPVEKTPGVKCFTRKSKYDIQCPEHVQPTIPLCSRDGCNKKCIDKKLFCDLHICMKNACESERFGRSSYCVPHTCVNQDCTTTCLLPSPFCQFHACIYHGCRNDARPGKGVYFCINHRCSDDACQSIKKFIESTDGLRTAAFCLSHECRSNNCENRKVPGKDHCDIHCCENKDCSGFRQLDLPKPLCLEHYNKLIKEQILEEYHNHIRAQKQLEAREAEKREEKLARERTTKLDEEFARQLASKEAKYGFNEHVFQESMDEPAHQRENEKLGRIPRDAEDREPRREEERMRKKREQEERYRQEKEDVRLRPEAAYEIHSPGYGNGRGERIGPKQDKNGSYRNYDERYVGPNPDPSGIPRSHQREHSPRVSEDFVYGTGVGNDIWEKGDRRDPYLSRPAVRESQRTSSRESGKDIWD